MPYLNKIFGAINTTSVRPAVIHAREGWVNLGGSNIKIYDGRPKLVNGTNAFWNNDDKRVELTWINASKLVTYFRVERKLDSGSWSLLEEVTVSGTQQLYELYDTNYVNGRVQHYRVFAYNQWGVVTDGVLEESCTIDTSPGGGGTFPITFNPVEAIFEVSGATIIDVTVTSASSWSITSVDLGFNPGQWFTATKINDSTLRISLSVSIAIEGDQGIIYINNGSSTAYSVSYGDPT